MRNSRIGQGVKVAYIDSGAPEGVAVEALSVDNKYLETSEGEIVRFIRSGKYEKSH